MRLLVFAGVRPNFVKLQALFDANSARSPGSQADIAVVHVMQHYDARLSSDLGLSYWQHVVARVGRCPAEIPERRSSMIYCDVRRWLQEHASPSDWVVVLGDAESTMAAALAASSIGLPLCHLEAGMRAPLESGPEAVIARAVDCVATLRLAASQRSFAQLKEERLAGSYFVGDLYLDLALAWRKTVPPRNLRSCRDVLVALHHVPDRTRFHKLVAQITTAIRAYGLRPVIIEHPKYRLEGFRKYAQGGDQTIGAVTHANMLHLVNNARYLVTDSGGLQRESFFLGRPCVVPRAAPWWPELVDAGAAYCIGDSLDRLEAGLAWAGAFSEFSPQAGSFGDGAAGTRIIDILSGHC